MARRKKSRQGPLRRKEFALKDENDLQTSSLAKLLIIIIRPPAESCPFAGVIPFSAELNFVIIIWLLTVQIFVSISFSSPDVFFKLNTANSSRSFTAYSTTTRTTQKRKAKPSRLKVFPFSKFLVKPFTFNDAVAEMEGNLFSIDVFLFCFCFFDLARIKNKFPRVPPFPVNNNGTEERRGGCRTDNESYAVSNFE